MKGIFKDTRLIEAFEQIDPKYIAEVGEKLKLRSVYSKDGEQPKNKLRINVKQITALAACVLLLVFAMPLFGYVVNVIGSFAAGDAGSGTEISNQSVLEDIESIPEPEETTQQISEMKNKYSEYGREEIGENGEKIFYLYTSEEYAAYLAAKENNGREPLTFEDVAFIINDSVRLYFEYDKIYFSDIVKTENGNKYMFGDLSNAVVNDFFDADKMKEARYVIPYHGDFSELSTGSAEDPESAEYRYLKMLDDIYVIIYRRLEVHCGVICELGYSVGSAPLEKYAGILLDGCEIQNADDYISESTNVIRKTVDAIKKGDSVTNEYPVVIVAPFTSKEVYISIVDNGASESIFPTKELTDLKPGQ